MQFLLLLSSVVIIFLGQLNAAEVDCAAKFNVEAINKLYEPCLFKAKLCNKDHICIGCSCPAYFKLVVAIPDDTPEQCFKPIKSFPGVLVNKKNLVHIKQGLKYVDGKCPALPNECALVKTKQMNELHAKCLAKATACKGEHECVACSCPAYFDLVKRIPNETPAKCFKDLKSLPGVKVSKKNLEHIKNGLKWADKCPGNDVKVDCSKKFNADEINKLYEPCVEKATACNKDHVCVGCSCPDYFKKIVAIPDDTPEKCFEQIKSLPGVVVNKVNLGHIKSGIRMVDGKCPKTDEEKKNTGTAEECTSMGNTLALTTAYDKCKLEDQKCGKIKSCKLCACQEFAKLAASIRKTIQPFCWNNLDGKDIIASVLEDKGITKDTVSGYLAKTCAKSASGVLNLSIFISLLMVALVLMLL